MGEKEGGETVSAHSSTEVVSDNRRRQDRKGIFTVVDGIDAVGKGEVIRALEAYEQRLGKAVFDTVAYSKAWEKLPELNDFYGIPHPHYNVIITAEPTYVGIGKVIREEIIAKNGKDYSAETEIQTYSLDRLVQMGGVVIPAIKNGLNVLQSRSIASVLTYQSLRANEEGRDPEEERNRILNHEGNKLQLEWAPDLVIIPTISDVNDLMARLRARRGKAKDDNAIFENAKFQSKLKPLYESDWLRKLLESHGGSVAYLNAGLEIEDSRNQAVDIYSQFLKDGTVPERYGGIDGLPK